MRSFKRGKLRNAQKYASYSFASTNKQLCGTSCVCNRVTSKSTQPCPLIKGNELALFCLKTNLLLCAIASHALAGGDKDKVAHDLLHYCTSSL